ncbi:hypothetical protein Pmani_031137 [Petrolisthes manimaculis]|uniref:Uncharacterized protein n=1 Tax=Petrolisthes manimaculis TaxID=1843537 RepID=A0AAE1NVQ8_9EUCA|nr:hypothetical protein Pmani_031137 [Petrolisthes manimaculis]
MDGRIRIVMFTGVGYECKDKDIKVYGDSTQGDVVTTGGQQGGRGGPLLWCGAGGRMVWGRVGWGPGGGEGPHKSASRGTLTPAAFKVVAPPAACLRLPWLP